MPLPVIFGNLPPNSQQPASLLDENFAALGALATVPCTCVTAGGLLTLTPLASAPTIGGALITQQAFGAIADATPNGAMTATIPNTSNGQGKKVFIDGVQASSRVAGGDYFVLVFDPALDGGNGGFFLLPTTAPAEVPPRIVTASSPITVGATDLLIIINQTSPAALAITLPDPATKVGPVVIKDWAGVAGTYNFTVSGATIDGQPSFVMDANFQSLGLRPVPGLGYAIT